MTDISTDRTSPSVRRERDCLGERVLPADALCGIHAERAKGNFRLSDRPVHATLIFAYGTVKRARASAEVGLYPRAYALREGLFAEAEIDALVSPEAACRLGMPDPPWMKG